MRASLFCVLAVVTALIALLLKHYIPDDFSRKVGARAVDNILQIIATSMLAVTTFSLSTMVAAYAAASSSVTPRSIQLLSQDRTAQNALSVFIGAFLYSLVGIIALSMEVYGDSGRPVLFLVTIGVIVVIVGVLLQWIGYLSQLGRVGETIDIVEKATAKALQRRMENPFLGGVELTEYKPRRGHCGVCYSMIGYVQHVDTGALSRLAEEAKAEFYLCATPGAFNDGAAPILYSSIELDEKQSEAVCDAFVIGDARSFDQDMRFGLVVLSEIASRALSPAVNDPGTAIDIIGTGVRLLATWVKQETEASKALYPHIHVPPLQTSDMFDDLFAGIARDGAGNLQVGVRLQKAFASLARMGDAETAEQARRLSAYALEYARKTLLLPGDVHVLSELAKGMAHSGPSASAA